MKRLISAIEFLTILPLGKPKIYDPRGMIPFFPVVGIILGALVSMVDQAALRLWTEPVVAVLDIALLVVLTGAFHVDGLGDTADGLLGHRTREQALTVMKDSRIGVMGVTAIVLSLSIKWAGIMSLGTDRGLLLIIIPAYARGGMLFGMRFLDYGRPDGGTGHPFFEEPLGLHAFWGLFIPALLSIFLGWKGVWLNISFIFLTITIIYYYNKRIGCITGDMLGAMAETTEALLFLLISIRGF
ncbi:MAG: adenosylcobinamide-GDP ribazoletransferase [Proteobacteria bacterium]|nr:adenosylcobinamide-GDP ribazoletransferase [Pseudomonadota bacterium]